MYNGPELPVIYENPRFDAATPTLQPVINRAIRWRKWLRPRPPRPHHLSIREKIPSILSNQNGSL
jgi:hypothetical protein